MIRRPPRSTRTDTLSLHDALPISLLTSPCPCDGIVRARARVAEMLRMLRSEEHTSELQSLMRISYAVFCLKKKKTLQNKIDTNKNDEKHLGKQRQLVI